MHDTIPGTLLAAAERDPGGTWLGTDDGSLTFAGAAALVARTVGRLRDDGIGHGDLVLLPTRNTPPHLLMWLALTSAGAVVLTANPASTAVELQGLVQQADPAHVLTDPHLDALVGDWRSDRPAGHEAALTGPPVTPEDIAVLIPTSGTTGRSKLVMQTHRAYAWAGQGFPHWMQLSAQDRLMTSLPLFHVNATAYSTMGSLTCGAGLVLLERFSASGFLDAARRHGATEFNAIGAMLEILMRQPERPDDADTPLRLCYTGPSPTRERQLQIEERFGLRIVCGYALSETPYGMIWPHGARPYGTLGTLRQHPELGVVNHGRVIDEDGRDLPDGQTGELLLRNPVITPGYWGMPEATAEAIEPDGWLHTGDLVVRDADGVHTFVARRKEVLRRRGENLSPLEVEEALTAHPAVAECAVIGVPSALSEEDVKAFVIPAEGASVDPAALRSWAAGRLAAFKVPRYVEVVAELPRTSTMRIAKHLLPTGRNDTEHDGDPDVGQDGEAATAQPQDPTP